MDPEVVLDLRISEKITGITDTTTNTSIKHIIKDMMILMTRSIAQDLEGREGLAGLGRGQKIDPIEPVTSAIGSLY